MNLENKLGKREKPFFPSPLFSLPWRVVQPACGPSPWRGLPCLPLAAQPPPPPRARRAQRGRLEPPVSHPLPKPLSPLSPRAHVSLPRPTSLLVPPSPRVVSPSLPSPSPFLPFPGHGAVRPDPPPSPAHGAASLRHGAARLPRPVSRPLAARPCPLGFLPRPASAPLGVVARPLAPPPRPRSLPGAPVAPSPATARVHPPLLATRRGVSTQPRRSAPAPARPPSPWRAPLLGVARPPGARPCAARPRPGAALARVAAVPLRCVPPCPWLGLGVRAIRSRRVSAALRARGALARLAVPSARRVASCHVRDVPVYP
jgi:hypothetical protein